MAVAVAMVIIMISSVCVWVCVYDRRTVTGGRKKKFTESQIRAPPLPQVYFVAHIENHYSTVMRVYIIITVINVKNIYNACVLYTIFILYAYTLHALGYSVMLIIKNVHNHIFRSCIPVGQTERLQRRRKWHGHGLMKSFSPLGSFSARRVYGSHAHSQLSTYTNAYICK